VTSTAALTSTSGASSVATPEAETSDDARLPTMRNRRKDRAGFMVASQFEFRFTFISKVPECFVMRDDRVNGERAQ